MTDLKAMYTDEGMFPRTEICYHYTTLWNWSFHFAYGTWAFQAVLFGIALALGVALLIGVETRIAAIGSWLMLMSVHHRVPPILSGADVLLRMLIFWGMFLPLSTAWSVDAWRQRHRGAFATKNSFQPVVSFASGAILLQMALMYFFSAIYKSNGSWVSGQTVAGALAHDFFSSSVGTRLLQLPWLLKPLTWGTFFLEWLALPLLFFPKGTPGLRVWLVAALALMHAGIYVFLKVDLFSPVSIAGLSLFLPPEFWAGLRLNLPGSARESIRPTARTDRDWSIPAYVFYVREGVCLLLLIYLVGLNINNLPSHPLTAQAPSKTTFLKTALGFGQKWSMFDEVPSKNGWYVAWAKLENGTDIDLLRGGALLNWNKPAFPAAIYPNYRWRKCFREMSYEDEVGYQVFRAPVAKYLCRDWNARNPQRRIAQFNLIFCNESASAQDSAAGRVIREQLVHLEFSPEDGTIAVNSP